MLPVLIRGPAMLHSGSSSSKTIPSTPYLQALQCTAGRSFQKLHQVTGMKADATPLLC
jgi:hypothetical protein